MYALIQNGTVAKYPYSINTFRKDNPNVGLPLTPTEAQLSEVGICSVRPAQRPADQFGKVVEESNPELVDGAWTQVWAVRDATTSELASQQVSRREQSKLDRQAAVDTIVVTTSSGKQFDGDELSQTRMARAIVALQAAGAPSITWILADNTVTEATVAELSEALAMAGAEQARLWVAV